MSRTVDITVAPAHTQALIGDIQRIQGVVGLRLQPGASLQPPGDVVSVGVTNSALHPLLHLLARDGIHSVTTSEPASMIAAGTSARTFAGERSEATWEEMQATLAKESNMTINSLALMLVSGALAAVGLATNALHYVIAAMLIAPGFEPLTRASLGLVAGGGALGRGLGDTLRGYAALVLGAALMTLVLQWLGKAPAVSEPSYLPAPVLIAYWSSATASSLWVSALAAVAGAILIATGRAVLTSGVMVALALIPAAALVGMGLATRDWSLGTRGLLRWMIEAVIVIGGGILVFLWKRVRVHRRRSLL